MISKSPERDTFQRDCHIKQAEENGQEPNPDYLDMFESIRERKDKQEVDPEWQKDNLEYDLRTTDWILEKVRTSDAYAQNLYAALCNNGFIKLDVLPILKNQEWGCSWRYAGGIVADMLQKGDYIDWYCSGIQGQWSDEEFQNATKEDQESYLYMQNNYAREGQITDEIRDDLQKLGWSIAPGGDWEKFEKE